jgi:hypothetical protein
LTLLEGSIKGLNEVEIKIDPFDVTKSLEDFWVTPERLAMAAKKTADWKKGVGREQDVYLQGVS